MEMTVCFRWQFLANSVEMGFSSAQENCKKCDFNILQLCSSINHGLCEYGRHGYYDARVNGCPEGEIP
jgi:hypothetical protein